VIEGGLLDGGQKQSCAFAKEDKPAAEVLGEQFGA
jgi:hypothetical protein